MPGGWSASAPQSQRTCRGEGAQRGAGLGDRGEGCGEVGLEVGGRARDRGGGNRGVVVLGEADQVTEADAAVVVEVAVEPVDAGAGSVVVLGEANEVCEIDDAVE